MSQNPEDLFDGEPTSFLGRTLCTSLRCHAFSATIALLVIGCMALIVKSKNWFAKDTLYSKQQVEDSTKLVSDSRHWRQEHARLMKLSAETESRVNMTEQWLPAEFEWLDVKDRIETVSTQTNVQLVTFEEGESHRGTRVEIRTANCIVAGTYEEICAFLNELPKLTHPVWCSQIRIVRDSFEDRERDQSSTVCTATLKLRLPHAGNGTVADKLFAAGNRNAS